MFIDHDIIDESTIDSTGPAYPVAQWLNGDPKLAAAGGVPHTGGVILPVKYVGESVPPAPGWTRTTVAFSTGKSELVLAAAKVRLAAVRKRFRWFIVQNGVTTYYPRSGYVADSGMRGHLQVLCSLFGYDFPVVITFKGKASQNMETILNDFHTKVTQAYKTIAPAGKPFPRFAFYMKVGPSAHVKAGPRGQESIITPPELELPAGLGEEYLRKIYVGRERLLELQTVYHEAEAWARAWDKSGAEMEPEGEDTDAGGVLRDDPPGPHSALGNGTSLRERIARLSQPSQAVRLLSEFEGDVLYTECVARFQVDRTTAGDIARECAGDWHRALCALDQHVF